MECPICKNTKHVELNAHPDGFAKNLQECGDCGLLWIRNGEEAIIVRESVQTFAVNQ